MALATIADVVPLRGREPHARAPRACARWRARPSPGLRALMAVAGVDPAQARRARGRLRAGAAAERRRAALPRRRGPRADPHRGPGARRADRRGARPRQPRAPATSRRGIRCEAEAQMAALGERAGVRAGAARAGTRA